MKKARKLKNLSQFVLKNELSNLKRQRIDKLRSKLLEINGIGPETADSIILYAFKKPIFVIDAYTKRVFSRLGYCHENISYDELQQYFHENLEADTNVYNEFHALIVQHAKLSCKKKPECQGCCLSKICKYSD